MPRASQAPPPPPAGFGERLTKARLALALLKGRAIGQAEIARELGVASMTVSRYEAGKAEPTLAMIEQLAGILHVSPCYLAFGIDVAVSVQPIASGGTGRAPASRPEKGPKPRALPFKKPGRKDEPKRRARDE